MSITGPVSTLFQDRVHGECLRLKVLRIAPLNGDTSLQPVEQADGRCEAFVHLQGTPAEMVGSFSRGDAKPLKLQSWDTVALSPAENPVLLVKQGSAVTVIAVLAC